MMTQNVTTQVSDLFSNSAKNNVTAANRSNVKNVFSSVMDQSMKSKDSNVKQTDYKENVKSGTNRPTTEQAKGVMDTKTEDQTIKTEDISQKVSTDTPVKNETEIDENLQDNIKKAIALLQDKVQEAMDLSTEELNKIMEVLGFAMFDLLNVDNLKQFVLQANGMEDITAILTDENLENSIQDMIQILDEAHLGEIFEMSDEELESFVKSDSFKDALLNLETKMSQNEKLPEQNASAIGDPLAIHVKEEEADVNYNQKEIGIEVYKPSDNNLDSNLTDTNSKKNKDTDVEPTTSMDAFIQNLSIMGNEDGQGFTEQIANIRQMQDITNQIVEQIKVIIKPDQSSMELQLNPENLGKISLSVISKDGVMTAHFTTQNELTKEAIESQMQVLRDSLNNQGLKVDSIEVTVSNFGFEESNQTFSSEDQQSESKRKGTFRNDSEIYTTQTDDDTLEIDGVVQNGSTVDYTA